MIKLKRRKYSLKYRISCVSKSLFFLEQKYYKLEQRKLRLINEYEEVDYTLALTDGRHKVIEVKAKKEKSTTDLIKELNIDQINKIAELLGISLEKEK